MCSKKPYLLQNVTVMMFLMPVVVLRCIERDVTCYTDDRFSTEFLQQLYIAIFTQIGVVVIDDINISFGQYIELKCT